MPRQRKRATSSNAKTAARGSAKKASSTAKRATSSTAKKATSTAKKAASSSTKTTRSAARKSTSAARKTASTARQQASKAIGDLTKPELVERLTTQLNKLKKDDLVGVVERVESGTLDLARLGVSGEGGFGFQEQIRGESDEDGGDRDRGGGNKGLIPRAGDALRDAAEKIGDKI